MNEFLWTLLGSIVLWVLNELRKSKLDSKSKKEDKYREMMRNVHGFSAGEAHDPAQIEEFVSLLDECWIYCPDNIVKNGYAFLRTVKVNNDYKEADREKALGEFVLSLRKDMGIKTKLTPCDYWFVGAPK